MPLKKAVAKQDPQETFDRLLSEALDSTNFEQALELLNSNRELQNAENITALIKGCRKWLEENPRNKSESKYVTTTLKSAEILMRGQSPASSSSSSAAKSTSEDSVVQMFSLVENYDASLRDAKPLPNHPCCDDSGAVRAHVFPKRALKDICGRADVQIKGGVKSLPCLILPKSWELHIDRTISDYAKFCSDTGEESKNGTRHTQAITQETEFAAQHPLVYGQIFQFLLLDLAKEASAQNKMTDRELDFLKQNLGRAQRIIRDISNNLFKTDALFGIPEAQRSRTKSDIDEESDAREVPENTDQPYANPPSLTGFCQFMEGATPSSQKQTTITSSSNTKLPSSATSTGADQDEDDQSEEELDAASQKSSSAATEQDSQSDKQRKEKIPSTSTQATHVRKGKANPTENEPNLQEGNPHTGIQSSLQ